MSITNGTMAAKRFSKKLAAIYRMTQNPTDNLESSTLLLFLRKQVAIKEGSSFL